MCRCIYIYIEDDVTGRPVGLQPEGLEAPDFLLLFLRVLYGPYMCV